MCPKGSDKNLIYSEILYFYAKKWETQKLLLKLMFIDL